MIDLDKEYRDDRRLWEVRKVVQEVEFILRHFKEISPVEPPRIESPFEFDALTDEQKADAVAGIELVIRFLRRYLRTAGQDPAIFKPEVRMRSVTPLTDVVKWLIRRCGENATLPDVLRDCALAPHPEKNLAEMQAIAALSDDPYFWYVTDITLRSLGNIEK